MLFIFFRGFTKSWLTLFLLTIYLSFFLFNNFSKSPDYRSAIEDTLDEHFIETQAHIYSHFVQEKKEAYSPEMRSLASEALKSHEESELLMAAYSLKDRFFFLKVHEVAYSDQVGYSIWKEKRERFLDIRKKDPVMMWGLSFFYGDWLRKFSYQFVHDDGFHFLINMIFFLLLAPLVESILGRWKFLLFYLSSGVFSALFFEKINGGLSISPLIGASGAICALLAFLSTYFGLKPIRYFWFIFPKKGYRGFVYLPAFFALVFRFISDLTGYIYGSEESVAYSVHLGGLLFGFVFALIVKLIFKSSYDKLKLGLKDRHFGFVETF